MTRRANTTAGWLVRVIGLAIALWLATVAIETIQSIRHSVAAQALGALP